MVKLLKLSLIARGNERLLTLSQESPAKKAPSAPATSDKYGRPLNLSSVPAEIRGASVWLIELSPNRSDSNGGELNDGRIAGGFGFGAGASSFAFFLRRRVVGVAAAVISGFAGFATVPGSGCSPLPHFEVGLGLVTASMARRCRSFVWRQRQQRHSDAVSVTSPGQRCRWRSANLRHLRAIDAAGLAKCRDPAEPGPGTAELAATT
jgi:hypothetical protein